jgi:arylsulfatase A
MRFLLVSLTLATFALAVYGESTVSHVPPNIVYILCDDLGYGDVHALNPERGKIATPSMDRLCAEGMVFTDCHSSSSICTPSRYSILTGRYGWRSRLQTGVLQGGSEPLISPARLTVAEFLRQHGYMTAAMGKWHLGLTFDKSDFTRAISDGPLQHGFDYFFGISASLDMPPYVYIENDRFTEVPSATKKFPSLMYGTNAGTGPVRLGPASPGFEAVDVVPKVTGKAVDYIRKRGTDKKPFFLYVALPSPHTPLVPTKEWQGKSGLGPYGDYVMETDWSAGQIMRTIDAAGLRENTLILLTSDNGCAPYAGVEHLEASGHYPSAQFRGYKSDIWEGGHRIPFIARWPGKIKADSQSGQIVCLADLLATCSDLLQAQLPDNAAEDSVSLLPALVGKDRKPLHEAIVNHSATGRFAIRKGNWKLELCPGSGGWGQPGDAAAVTAGLPIMQLYDMHDDIGEKQYGGQKRRSRDQSFEFAEEICRRGSEHAGGEAVQ